MTTRTQHGMIYSPAGEGQSAPHGRMGDLLLTGAQTAGALTLFRGVFPPGASLPPLHTHPVSETFVVLAGEALFTGLRSGGAYSVRAGPGAVVYVPADAPHTFALAGPAPLRLLIATLPGGFEQYFADIAAVVPAGLPPYDALRDPTLRERFAAVNARYGVAYVHPDDPATWGVGTPIRYVMAGEGAKLPGPTGTDTLKLASAETDGALSLIERDLPPGTGSPPLQTQPEAETFYLLDGMVEFSGATAEGTDTVVVRPGDVVYVPPRTPHCVTVVGAETARALVIVTPGRVERDRSW